MEVNVDKASRLVVELATELNVQLANLVAGTPWDNDEGRNESNPCGDESKPCGDDSQYGQLKHYNPSNEYRVSLYLCDFVEHLTVLTFAHRTQNNRKRILNSCIISTDEPLHKLVNSTTAENIPNFPNNIAAISTMTI